MALSDYIPILNAMVSLMKPLLEIVVHDIKSNKIIYINGDLSARKVGDPSLLETEALIDIDQTVYPKINFDGRLIKSISIILEKKWLLCINYDVSLFNKIKDLSEIILQVGGSNKPKSLFANDWQEKLHVTIHEYLQSYHLSFEHLNAKQKKALVKHIWKLGAFQEKKAADYVGKVLGLGRATVFKYLKEWRSQ